MSLQTLRMQLPIALVGIGLISSLIVGWIGWSGASNGLSTAASDKLALAAASRRVSLQLVADRLRLDARNFASLKAVRGNVLDLSQTIRSSEKDFEELKAYFNKPQTIEERRALSGGDSGKMYGIRHRKVHSAALKLLEQGNYEDVMLIDLEGRVVYSVDKRAEFGIKVDDDELKNSGLDELFAAMKAADDQTVSFHDFSKSILARGETSAFIGVPILQRTNVAMDRAQGWERAGFVVIQFGPKIIDQVFEARDGLGQTGETFAVGADGLLRTNPPLVDGTLAGEPATSIGLSADHDGTSSLTRDGQTYMISHKGVEFLGAKWTVYAEQANGEALGLLSHMLNGLALACIVICIGQILIGGLVARGIVKPIDALTRALQSMARGEKLAEISGMQRKDEIGDIARAVDEIRKFTAEEAARQAEAEETMRKEQEAQRKDMTRQLAREFEERMGTVVKAVASSAEELEKAAHELSDTSHRSREGSKLIASASNTASHEVAAVAQASEQLADAVREISEQTFRSSGIAREADEHAASTQGIVKSLSEKTHNIQNIADLINDIAEQTNLLALNATIEAARAGEAGRGFAVVASEVKELAGQTASATEQIGSQITEIIREMNTAVEAVSRIRDDVSGFEHAVTSISSAVEQQSAATKEISGSAHSAATETGTVSQSIEQVSEAIVTTDTAATSLVKRARDLGSGAEALKSSLNSFLEKLLAA